MNARASWPTMVSLMLVVLAAPASASAFCGFYVGGGDAALTNDATLVVMMREGTHTALSMQNAYEGPPEGFALVVPVPVVLSEDDVRILPHSVFDRVERLSSPRLVEYWELDPCNPHARPPRPRRTRARPRGNPRAGGGGGGGDLGVTIEAQFEVGEYEIVILSARDSSGLETWLQREEYNIPEGAADVLRPYVEQGTKFFVARVNVERVTFENGRAVLSPLRVHYDHPEFSLPVRLGLLNSAGTQDLVVHILARNQRYEVANYPNVTIPTNLDVADEVRERFGEFYATLFDLTLERNPGAVVTEYAWQATSCDPCPGPTMTLSDLVTLGADVVSGVGVGQPSGGRRGAGRRSVVGGLATFGGAYVLTRLHYRYSRESLDEDLVFRAAEPIVGGRERMMGTALEHGSRAASTNNFQGRYAIRHVWEGPIECDAPIRARWGGPPDDTSPRAPQGATDLASARRGGMELPRVLRTSAPEIQLTAALQPIQELISGVAEAQAPPEPEAAPVPAEEPVVIEERAPPESSPGCGACTITGRRPSHAPTLLLALGVLLGWRRRSLR